MRDRTVDAPLSGRVPFADRVPCLARVRDHLVESPAAVMEILVEVSTRRAARYELQAAVATLDGAVEEVTRHQPRSVDAAAVFMPSNVLLYSYVLYLLVPSLFVGRVGFRPSSQVSDQVLRLHQRLGAVHGLPIEALPVSQRTFLTEHVATADVVVFTGTYSNAEEIRSRLHPNQLFLFLGAGVNPFVVAPQADLTAAAGDAVEIRLLNSGQDCLAPDIFLVHQDLLDDFVDAVIRELKAQRYGDNADPKADYGPIYYEGALEEAALYLFRNHRYIVHGGSVDFRTRRLDPAVLVRPLEGKPKIPEFFAPVFNVVAYRDEASVTQLLTGGALAERALGATVYGHAPRLVDALRRRHTVTVNTSLLTIDDGNAPFGGYGGMANAISYGRTHRVEPILVSKAVADHLPADHVSPRRQPVHS